MCLWDYQSSSKVRSADLRQLVAQSMQSLVRQDTTAIHGQSMQFPSSMKLSREGERVAAGIGKCTIIVEQESFQPLLSLQFREGGECVSCLDWSPAVSRCRFGELLAAGFEQAVPGSAAAVAIWDVGNGSCMGEFCLQTEVCLRAV